MDLYKAYEYFTLESKTKGELMIPVFHYEKGKMIHRRGLDPYTVKKFDTYEEAYTEMISLYDAESYNREPHGYWYIKKHLIVEYMENEEYHRNERIEPCVAV